MDAILQGRFLFSVLTPGLEPGRLAAHASETCVAAITPGERKSESPTYLIARSDIDGNSFPRRSEGLIIIFAVRQISS